MCRSTWSIDLLYRAGRTARVAVAGLTWPAPDPGRLPLRYVLARTSVTARRVRACSRPFVAARRRWGRGSRPTGHPLATDTAAAAMQPPSARALVRHRRAAARRPAARRSAAARLDFGIALAWRWRCRSVTGIALGHGSRATTAAGGRPRRSGRLADTIMAFPLLVRVGDGHRRGARQHRWPTSCIATAIINLPFYLRVARAEANVRRDAGFVEAARLAGNGDCAGAPGRAVCSPTSCRRPWCRSRSNMGLGHPQLRPGCSFIGLGVRPPAPQRGIMVAEGAHLHRARRRSWWVALFPGAVLMLAVLCFNLPGRRACATSSSRAGAHERRDPLRIEGSLEFGLQSTRSGAAARPGRASTLAIREGRDRSAWSAGDGSGKLRADWRSPCRASPAAATRWPAAPPASARPRPARSARESDLADIRGREIAMIFQNPSRAALDPIRRVVRAVLGGRARCATPPVRSRAICATPAPWRPTLEAAYPRPRAPGDAAYPVRAVRAGTVPARHDRPGAGLRAPRS
jgi:peptide/nickel transport system permease protein